MSGQGLATDDVPAGVEPPTPEEQLAYLEAQGFPKGGGDDDEH